MPSASFITPLVRVGCSAIELSKVSVMIFLASGDCCLACCAACITSSPPTSKRLRPVLSASAISRFNASSPIDFVNSFTVLTSCFGAVNFVLVNPAPNPPATPPAKSVNILKYGFSGFIIPVAIALPVDVLKAKGIPPAIKGAMYWDTAG